MSDIIQKIGHSIIQHGKENNRIYLMKYNEVNALSLLEQIEKLGRDNNYNKIVAKVPLFAKNDFEDYGYKKEAYIPNYFNRKDDCFFMCKYLHEGSPKNHSNEIADILSDIKDKTRNDNWKMPKLPKKFNLRILTKNDTKAMSALYKTVFATYPFPIFDPNYLVETMEENIIYFGIFDKNKLIGVSSCETDTENMNCEMTDFAILPDYRGGNLSLLLLKEMEDKMIQMNFKVLYTIARAISYGMNMTFAKLGYKFSGTLYNNTNISGNIEHMNIWYKLI